MDKKRRSRILSLAIPIIGGMVSQNILNLVDTYMVGHLGNAALGAVGLGGFANFMCQALILGVSVGVQATAARRKGEGRIDEMAAPLNAGLLVTLITGLVFSLALIFLVPRFYHILNDDPDVIAQGVPYLQARVAAIMFVGMNFSFRGYWNAIDLSRLYMMTLMIMHFVNILLNYVFIFGKFGAPELGALGAGIGTSASTALGTCIYFYLGFKHARANGFLHSLPSLHGVKDLVRLSIPSSIQQLFFSGGFVVTYIIIGKIGTAQLAAANVLINITLVAILPAIALGMAAATLVGQALGRGEPEDAYQWGWDVVRIGVVGIGVLGFVMLLFPAALLTPFIKDPNAVELGILPMRMVGAGIALDAMGLILMNALLGAGATFWVMKVSLFMQWIVFLPLAWFFGPFLGMGLNAIWLLQTGYRGVQAIIFAWLWRGGKWKDIKV